MSPPSYITNDPARLAVFTDNADSLIPDPAVFSEWFDKASEKKRRLAVGSRRYSVMQELLDRPPEFKDFIDAKAGDLMPIDYLESESLRQRRQRLDAVQAVVDERRGLIKQVMAYGWVNQ